MRLSNMLYIAIVFLAAALLALATANASVQLIEDSSEISVRDALDNEGLTWAEVEADGLQVAIAGTAPNEAIRFRALSVAGSVVDATRLIDEMEVTSTAALSAPRFSVEVLRNTSGLSVIGLVPETTDRDALRDELARLTNTPVTDLLESAAYPAPQGWDDAVAYGLRVMKDLPRAKISIDAGRVAITAISDSIEERDALETRLQRAAPPGLRLVMNISAPRPVITPFTLRFVIDDSGPHFDACSADTEATMARILAAAQEAGMTEPGRCTIGMGVPTPTWGNAAQSAIRAVADLGAGAVTFSDADITLVAAEGTPQRDFDRVVGELEAALPDVFALHAVLPEPPAPTSDEGPPEFLAILSPEGQVQLRGRVPDEDLRTMADSFARARFGSGTVYTAARIAPDLPPGWGARVLTALETLTILSHGVVTVTPTMFTVAGDTGDPDASTKIASLLAEKLGEESQFEINVSYSEALDPVASLPTPEECEARIEVILERGKITFEPGNATIDESALGIMDDIATVLQECGDLRLEIQGHTDSQGREEMNLSLSQARAQSVLNELQARRVLTSSFVAKGYGETKPIADNATEDGREANRRIEFRLIRPETSEADQETTLESLAESSDTNDSETAEGGSGDE